MRVSIYFDVAPWMTSPQQIFPACSQPMMKKPDDVTRYRIDVDIPDPALVDKIIKTEAVEVTGEGG